MPKQLPPNPSISKLKKQSKGLLKSHQAGEAEAIVRIRAHLPRLARAPDDEILADTFVLQEAQHVIATEYGFRSWNWLQAAVEPDFDVLAGLTDREIQTLMHDCDQKDLAACFKGASDALKDRFLGNMSERVRARIVEEMEFFGPMPEELVRDVQRRVMVQAAQLAAEGQIDWPNGQPRAPATGGPPDVGDPARLRELIARRLDDLSTDEVVGLWFELAELARKDGMPAWDPVADDAADPFVQEAMRLAVDYTEPPLLADILQTRSERALLAQQDTRGMMVIKAVMAIQSKTNPGIIHHELGALYHASASGQEGGSYTMSGNAQLRDTLTREVGAADIGSIQLDELSMLLARIGEFARHEGVAMLGALADAAPEGLLKRGLRLAADQAEPDEVLRALQTQHAAQLEASRRRHRMTIAGAEAVQEGETPAQVETAVRAVRDREWKTA
jgi:hypothetical protein